MLARFSKEKLKKMARKAKMARQKPLKVVEAPTPTEDMKKTPVRG